VDDKSLDHLLKDGRERQFWLKPIGPPKDDPDWGAEEHRTWTEAELEIHFSKNPVNVAVGAVLIAFRVRYSKLIYVAERLPVAEWSKEEVRSLYSRRRYPYYIKARNLTPEYGKVWNQFCLQPFPLAEQYNVISRENPAQLGSIKRGNDKARIPTGFAELLIRSIRKIGHGQHENSGWGTQGGSLATVSRPD
jgi:hypothetical protein